MTENFLNILSPHFCKKFLSPKVFFSSFRGSYSEKSYQKISRLLICRILSWDKKRCYEILEFVDEELQKNSKIMARIFGEILEGKNSNNRMKRHSPWKDDPMKTETFKARKHYFVSLIVLRRHDKRRIDQRSLNPNGVRCFKKIYFSDFSSVDNKKRIKPFV